MPDHAAALPGLRPAPLRIGLPSACPHPNTYACNCFLRGVEKYAQRRIVILQKRKECAYIEKAPEPPGSGEEKKSHRFHSRSLN